MSQPEPGKACFHCNGTDLCDCVSCFVESPTGRIPGKCAVCKGRKEMTAILERMEREGRLPISRKHFKRIGNKRDQAAAKLVFDPFDEIKL